MTFDQELDELILRAVILTVDLKHAGEDVSIHIDHIPHFLRGCRRDMELDDLVDEFLASRQL
jgi:hypothetical protein